MFVQSRLHPLSLCPLPGLYKGFGIPRYTFTLKMATAMSAEMLENHQHLTLLIPESRLCAGCWLVPHFREVVVFIRYPFLVFLTYFVSPGFLIYPYNSQWQGGHSFCWLCLQHDPRCRQEAGLMSLLRVTAFLRSSAYSLGPHLTLRSHGTETDAKIGYFQGHPFLLLL